MTPNGEAALRLAEFGFRVFPLWENSKKPFIDKWNIKACTDPGIISAWYRIHNLNIGIATGANSGCIVFDWDGPAGAGTRNMLAAKHGALPLTPAVRTGKGEHEYFRYPGGEDIRNKQNQPLLPGWDLRGNGGYVVAPPSRHPNGHSYEWIRSPWDYDLQDLPEPWLDLIIKPPPPNYEPTALQPGQTLAGAELHAEILSRYGQLLRRWYDPEQALDYVICWNAVHGKPPLPLEEIIDIADYANGQEAKRVRGSSR
jgi:hypothetical protein